MKKLSIVLSLVVLFLSSQSATASLIINGGFETGDFTGWTYTAGDPSAGEPYSGVDGLLPHSGNYSAYLGDVNTPGTLSQIITTNVQSYELSMYLYSDGLTPNQFKVQWNGITLYEVTDLPPQDWVRLSFSVLGTGKDTLTFSERNDKGYLNLDDVSLTVPEPSTYILLSIALGVVGYARKKMNKRA